MAVAKSYQAMEQVCEPYKVNGRMYVKVNTGKITRQVRWYTDAEYERLYPEVKIIKAAKSQKEVLGFTKGYITIFKGDTFSNLDWFKASTARYAKFWGWYIISTEEVPEDLPEGIEPVKLYWDAVGDGEKLAAEAVVAAAVDSLLYEAGSSEYVGNIGDRLSLVLTVTKAIALDSGYYGPSTMHVMEDDESNIFVWTTSAKSLPESATVELKGTVKDHKIYKNNKQTILTRCLVSSIKEAKEEEE